MSEKKEQSTNLMIGIVSTVVGGIILMVIEPTRSFIIKILGAVIKWIVYILKIVLSYLSTTHQVNGFLFIVLLLLSSAFIILWIVSLIRDSKNSIRDSYTQDVFYNVVWKWYWSGDRIQNLWCFCNYCDYELTYDDSSMHKYSHDQNPRIDLYCDHCGRIVGSAKQMDKDYLLSVVTREIMRNIRQKEKTLLRKIKGMQLNIDHVFMNMN